LRPHGGKREVEKDNGRNAHHTKMPQTKERVFSFP